jgi:hypothetical protein
MIMTRGIKTTAKICRSNGKDEKCNSILVEYLKRRGHLGNLSEDGNSVSVWIRTSWLRMKSSDGLLRRV